MGSSLWYHPLVGRLQVLSSLHPTKHECTERPPRERHIINLSSDELSKIHESLTEVVLRGCVLHGTKDPDDVPG